MSLTASDLRAFFPRGQPAWIEVLADLAPALMKDAGITTPLRWRHFAAQVAAETDGLSLKSMRESLHYSQGRILQVFDYRLGLAQKSKRFKGKSKAEIARILAADPELLAETVYGNRGELGNWDAGDGARYIGRGPMQTTGRDWYARIGAELGLDLVAKPELLEQPEIGWRAAFCDWRLLGCNALADRDSILLVSKRVNGGSNGLARRKAEYVRALAIWPDGVAATAVDASMPARPEQSIVPRQADAPPAPVTPAAIAADGSRSMSWLQQVKLWLLGSGTAISTWFGADTFGSFKGTLNEIKSLLADHALVLLLLAILIGLAVVVLVQHYLVQAVEDGRYTPRKGG